MTHLGKILYGAFAYLAGLGGLTYFALFLGGWDFLPRHIDSDAPGSLALAVVINVGIILLFGLQHSVMARPGFKKVWTKVVPPELERATYVLLSGVFMFAIGFFWQPVAGVLWSVESEAARLTLISLYASGFVIMVAASFMINHFDLFGLEQIYRSLRQQPAPQGPFKEILLYGIVRHPIQLGMLLCMWCTPTMSATHAFLAATMTGYIFVGLYFEERDLISQWGHVYRDYQRRVRGLLPIPRLGRAKQPAPQPVPARGN